MTTLADKLLPDALWQRVQPILPPPPSRARGGAPRTVSDRTAPTAPLTHPKETHKPMGRIIVEAFIVTTDPVPVYGGVQFPEEEMSRLAEQIRRGGLPMLGNHDERLRLKPCLLEVDVRRTDSGAVGVWVEFEIDEEVWKAAEEAMGGIGGFSVSVVEAYRRAQADASKPFVQIASDAAHFDDDLRDEVAEALRPYFDVNSTRLYQFAESPPAKVIIEFGVPLLIFIQSVGINVFSSALWDGLKLFLREKQAGVTKLTSRLSWFPVVVVCYDYQPCRDELSRRG